MTDQELNKRFDKIEKDIAGVRSNVGGGATVFFMVLVMYFNFLINGCSFK